jgi:hypothetical protein
MVERSRRTKEEDMNEKATRMVFATAALAAVAAVLAGPAGANITESDGVGPVSAQSQGVDVAIATAIEAQSARPLLTGTHAALERNRHDSTSVAPLPHGIQVEYPQSSEVQSLGLTGDSARTRVYAPATESLGLTGDSPLNRVSAPEPEGLTGDSALTRVPETAPTPTVSGGDDIDWTSFGVGAGMVALVAGGLAGILLTARRRQTIGLP